MLRMFRITHRDLKPSNIYLHKEELVIGDFGLSFVGTGPMKHFIGTPYFMAPEILTNDGNSHYDEKCDIWSLGLCFYFILFGHYPFSTTKDQSELLM